MIDVNFWRRQVDLHWPRTLSERLAAEGGEARVEGQQPAANPSRAGRDQGRAEGQP